MSRIGKKPIPMPKGVTYTHRGCFLHTLRCLRPRSGLGRSNDCRPLRLGSRRRFRSPADRLAAIVVGNDPPDRGENFLHRGFLRLRRLTHWP